MTDWQTPLRELRGRFAEGAGTRDLWHGHVIDSNLIMAEEQWGVIALDEPLTRKPVVGRTTFRTEGDGVYFGTVDPALFRADANAAFRCVEALPVADGIKPGRTRDHSDGWIQVLYRLASQSATPLLQARVRERQILGPDEDRFEYVRFAMLERDIYSSSAAAADLLLGGRAAAPRANAPDVPADASPNEMRRAGYEIFSKAKDVWKDSFPAGSRLLDLLKEHLGAVRMIRHGQCQWVHVGQLRQFLQGLPKRGGGPVGPIDLDQLPDDQQERLLGQAEQVIRDVPARAREIREQKNRRMRGE